MSGPLQYLRTGLTYHYAPADRTSFARKICRSDSKNRDQIARDDGSVVVKGVIEHTMKTAILMVLMGFVAFGFLPIVGLPLGEAINDYLAKKAAEMRAARERR